MIMRVMKYMFVGFFGLIFLAALANQNHSSSTSAVPAPSGAVKTEPTPKEEVLSKARIWDLQMHKGGFNAVLLLDLGVNNPTTHAFKDFEIKCETYAPSRTARGEI
jgi:type IV secretory pathway TrbL component